MFNRLTAFYQRHTWLLTTLFGILSAAAGYFGPSLWNGLRREEDHLLRIEADHKKQAIIDTLLREQKLIRYEFGILNNTLRFIADGQYELKQDMKAASQKIEHVAGQTEGLLPLFQSLNRSLNQRADAGNPPAAAPPDSLPHLAQAPTKRLKH